MSVEHFLSGGCSCGRNRYTVTIPPNTPARESAQVFFSSDPSHQNPHHPLTLYLHLPLDWLRSSTHSLTVHPLETHAQIRRSYHPTDASQHYFCGFCGTHLTYWTESPAEEKEFINLAVPSLGMEGLRELDTLGLLPGDDEEDEGQDQDMEGGANLGTEVGQRGQPSPAVPWFDTLLSGSRLSRTARLGHHRTRRSQQSGPGWSVEWEITEWVGDGDDPDTSSGTTTPSKRKISEVEGTAMEH